MPWDRNQACNSILRIPSIHAENAHSSPQSLFYNWATFKQIIGRHKPGKLLKGVDRLDEYLLLRKSNRPLRYFVYALRSSKVLELDSHATKKEIKTAYRLLIKVWRPDQFKGDESRMYSAEQS